MVKVQLKSTDSVISETTMTEILIKVERDSVCMGDDCDAPHLYSFKISNNSALIEVFEHLERKRYLASVAGKNHSWEAVIENRSVAFFMGNNQLPEPSAVLSNKIFLYAKNSILEIWFKYNSAAS